MKVINICDFTVEFLTINNENRSNFCCDLHVCVQSIKNVIFLIFLTPYQFSTFSLKSELKMNTRKWFLITTNLIGINFTTLQASLPWIFISQIFSVGFGFYFSFYRRILSIKKVSAHTIMDKIQIEVLFFIQIIFVIRAFRNRFSTKVIFELLNCERQPKDIRAEKVFLAKVFFIFILRFSKMTLVDSRASLVYMVSATFSELVMASNDFLFESLISKMTLRLKEIRKNLVKAKQRSEIQKIQNEIFHHFELKMQISKRYSVEIFATTFYNYVQLIISLYWIFMRVKFGRMYRINGNYS